MKKKVLSLVLSATLIAGTTLASFTGALVSAAVERVHHTWTVAGDLLGALETATNAATEELSEGDTLTGEMVASKLEFGAISFTPNTYGNKSIGSAVFSQTGYSSINTGAHSQSWRAQLQIPNNQGLGEGFNNSGVIVRNVRPEDTQNITFTAPVHGVYNFVPQGIGGETSIKESVAVSTGSMKVEVFVKNESKGSVSVDSDDTTEDITTSGNLPEIKGIELKKGEQITLNFNPITFDETANAANAVFVNFKVDITDEIAPQILKTKLKTDSYNVVEELQLSGTSASVPVPKGIFSVGYAEMTGGTGEDLDPALKPGLYSEANGYTWYYGTYGGDTSYGLVADADDNTLDIKSKYLCMNGIIITADKTGRYTLSAESVSKGGAGAMTLKIEDSEGNILYSNGDADTDGFSVEVSLKAGDKLYFYADRTGDDWQTANMLTTGLTLDVVYTTKVVPAVYKTTPYDVSEELLKNTGNWNTVYQDPTDFQYSGILSAASVEISGLTLTDAFCRLYADYDSFSNANQNYENNTMNVYHNGVMGWSYDNGTHRMGFKFTASKDADYVLSSAKFTTASSLANLNAYVYKVTDGGLVMEGSPSPVSADSGLSLSLSAKEGETFVIVLGKASSGWNNKRTCFTETMTLSEKVVISPRQEIDIVLEYEDDPDYVFVYEKPCEHEYDDDEDFICNLCGEERAKPYHPEFYISSDGGTAGEEVEVYLGVKNVKSHGLTVQIAFDKNVLEAVGSEELQELGEMSEINSCENANARGIYSYSMFSVEDTVFSDGNLLKFTFKIKETAALGNSAITISNIVFGYSEGTVPFENCITENGEISVSEREEKLGDLDGNGTTNIIDVQKLFTLVANGLSGEVALAVGDFDGNGTINIIDVQQLFVAVANGQIS